MPIHVNGGACFTLVDCMRWFTSASSSCDDFNSSAVEFSSSECHIISVHHRTLYVMEGELALNIDESNFDFIGSDDATTCHILLARHNFSRRVMVAHVDCADRCRNLRTFLDQMVQPNDCKELEVYIIGGFIDSNNCSMDVTKALLTELSSTTAKCNLRLYCSGHVNTGVVECRSKPKVLGAGFLVTEQGVQVVRAQVHLSLRGPVLSVRHARHLNTTSDQFRIVYDGLQGNHFMVDKFANKLSRAYIRQLQQMNSVDFMSHTSTSPEDEPEHFEQCGRATLQLCATDEIAALFKLSKQLQFCPTVTALPPLPPCAASALSSSSSAIAPCNSSSSSSGTGGDRGVGGEVVQQEITPSLSRPPAAPAAVFSWQPLGTCKHASSSSSAAAR